MQGESSSSLEVRLGPWLFGARTDLLLFAGSSLLALAVGGIGSALGVTSLPDYAWVVLVLGVDVAHVHATWFRTYFDKRELARRPLRYGLLPLVAYAASAFLYRHGALVFWRVLAYLAAFHFVRQQVGWVALYRARSGRSDWSERVLDEAAVYAATLYPLFVWHAHASEKAFSWFVPGDFVSLSLGAWLPVARALWVFALGAFVAREAARFVRQRAVDLGKLLVVIATALTWYVGIVVSESDFLFTASNVIPHGVPYAFLLFTYTRARSSEAPRWSWGQVASAGFVAFGAVLLGLSFVEQLAWDRLVEHDRPWLFGAAEPLAERTLAWLVPLLALPQTTHYLLDALLWRRAEARELPALHAALGLPLAAPAPSEPAELGPVQEIAK